jgi:HEAT repeat protein
MMIHFRCRRCRNAVSVGARQADCPMLCPVCKGEIVVPSASEIAPPGEPGMLVPGARPSAVSSPPVAHAPCSPQKAKKHPRKRMGRRALIAVSVGVLVFVAAGWMSNRVWSKWRQPAAPDTALLEENDSDDAVADVDLPPAPSTAEERPDVAAHEARLASGLKEEEETVQGEWSKTPARPSKVEGAKSESRASSGNLVVKRRREFSEEELRKQLLWAPEVGITPADVPEMTGRFLLNQYQDPGDEYLRLEPTYVVAQLPDLKTLPLRRGLASRIDANAAREIQFLGRELHRLVDQHAVMNRDKQPSTVLIGEFMKLETRADKKANWIRPEAVPTLQQILGHEDLEVRLLLVDLLGRIEGRASSLALVQRAVFDVSSEVRVAAIKALNDRPHEQFRSALVAALRYPWSPAADHAAETLAALKDRDAAPLLVRMLKEPDPTAPVARKDRLKNDHLWKWEVVRVKHKENCMLCHPPSNSGTEPAQGMVPGFAVIDKRRVVPTASLPASLQNLVTGGSTVSQRFSNTAPNTASTLLRNGYAYEPTITESSVAPFTVRGDITYLRQDFSIQLPALVTPPADFANLRFDYVVRFRPLTERQTHEWKTQTNRPETYEQRDAVLFALRELTGQDAGPTTEAWEKLYPTSEFEQWTTKLTMALVDAPDHQKLTLIKKLRDAKGVAHTEALAQAIPQLAEVYQPKARAALIERMKRMSRATLRDKLADESREIRLAAATVVGWKEEAALLPDLKALLDDPEPEVADAAQIALKSLKVREAKAGDGAQ